MGSNEIREKVLDTIKANIEEIEISAEQSDEDLLQHGMDSITFIQIVVALENTLEIEIPDEKLLLEEMGTLNKMINVVTAALNAKETI
ncbi:MAG: acyl carrier protein [Clostridiales bacterium]|nr:acyl carrier protein [Clostridiales bacterium]